MTWKVYHGHFGCCYRDSDVADVSLTEERETLLIKTKIAVKAHPWLTFIIFHGYRCNLARIQALHQGKVPPLYTV